MENQEKLRALQLVQLEILKRVDEVCRKNNIRYYMIGGTLLGAVRHKGFIPWDDDIDIAMPRKDYERFLSIASKELGDDFFVQNHRTDKMYHRYMTKIRANGTRQVEKSIAHTELHHGIFIDIFPLDNIVKRHGYAINLRGRIIRNLFRIMKVKVRRTDGKIKQWAYPARLVPNRLVNLLLDWLFTLSNSNKAKYITSFASIYGWKKQAVPNEVYGNGVELRFEGMSFFAPAKYDVLLKQLFGNYMKLPPVEKRANHVLVEVELGKYSNIIKDQIPFEGKAKPK